LTFVTQKPKVCSDVGFWYTIYLLNAIGLHPVAVAQYTFTHKQYTKNTTKNHVLIGWSFLFHIFDWNCIKRKKILGEWLQAMDIASGIRDLVRCLISRFRWLQWSQSRQSLANNVLRSQRSMEPIFSVIYWHSHFHFRFISVTVKRFRQYRYLKI